MVVLVVVLVVALALVTRIVLAIAMFLLAGRYHDLTDETCEL